MAEVIEGKQLGKGLRFRLVVSRFNEFATKAMLEGALNELRRSGIQEAELKVAWVPGAFEIPLACQSFCEAGNVDGLIAIGCIIRGETTHYEHLAQSVFTGIQKVILDYHIPIGFGVITAENMAQAMDRAGGKQGNKGRDAARSALEMVSVTRELTGGPAKEAVFKEYMERELNRQ